MEGAADHRLHSKANDLRAIGANATLGRDDPLLTDAFDVVVDLVGAPAEPIV